MVDGDVLIDAGTGLGDLSLEDMAAIDHVFLTHSHLDHVAALPFMLDTVGATRRRPVTVHAQPATIKALSTHLFNGVIWPDFSRIPTPEQPFMRWQALEPGGEVEVHGRRFRSVSVNHTVPAVGYLVSGASGSFAFTGDTAAMNDFWEVINARADLKHLVIETSFLDKDEELCRIAKHLSPRGVAGELAKLKSAAQVHITHLMPGLEEETMREIAGHMPSRTPRRLRRGDILEF